jgi:hypothetical protein
MATGRSDQFDYCFALEKKPLCGLISRRGHNKESHKKAGNGALQQILLIQRMGPIECRGLD